MKRLVLFTAAAFLAATPAAVGLAGNSSLSPSVPVDPPTQAVLDDSAGVTGRDQRTEPGDDRGSQGGGVSPSATPDPSGTVAADDHGGRVERDDRVEPGDDRDARTAPQPAGPAPAAPAPATDDSGHHGGAGAASGHDDGPTHDAGDDHGGDRTGGGGDEPGDDSGHGGHGNDD